MQSLLNLAKEEVIVNNESEQEKFVREMMEDFDRSDLDGNGSMDFSEYIRQVWSDETQVRNICFFLLSFPQNERKCISFTHLVLLSLYIS